MILFYFKYTYKICLRVTAEPKPQEIRHVDSPTHESFQHIGIKDSSEYKSEDCSGILTLIS